MKSEGKSSRIIPLAIERVVELEGILGPDERVPSSFFAYVTAPTADGPYAALAPELHDADFCVDLGILSLENGKYISSYTGSFTPLTDSHEICGYLSVESDYLSLLQTLDEVLSFPGVRIVRDVLGRSQRKDKIKYKYE